MTDIAAELAAHDVLVDGMVGTGSSGTGLRGAALDAVRALLPVVRAGGIRVVAVDVPSGIGVDDGTLPDDRMVLPADLTVTFGAAKTGLLTPPASRVCGEVRLIDIGLGLDPGAGRVSGEAPPRPRR